MLDSKAILDIRLYAHKHMNNDRPNIASNLNSPIRNRLVGSSSGSRSRAGFEGYTRYKTQYAHKHMNNDRPNIASNLNSPIRNRLVGSSRGSRSRAGFEGYTRYKTVRSQAYEQR